VGLGDLIVVCNQGKCDLVPARQTYPASWERAEEQCGNGGCAGGNIKRKTEEVLRMMTLGWVPKGVGAIEHLVGSITPGKTG